MAVHHGHDGENERHIEGQAEGFIEKVHMLLAQEMISTDAHDKETAQHISRADGVHELVYGVGLGHHRKEIGELGPAVANGVADRVLHPGVGSQDPQSRQVGRKRHHPDGHGMGLSRKAVPAERPHRNKS